MTLRAARIAGILLTCMTLPMASFGGTAKVRIETTEGDIVVHMDTERSPLTVQNFLQYARDGHYEGTIFHRIVNGFVIQGGGYDVNLVARPTRQPIPNESGNGLTNRRGTIGMARVADPHSADAQFYINLADNLTLDPKPTRWGFVVFGEVVAGMEVVDEIGHRATTSRGEFDDVPLEPVVLKKVVVLADGGS